MCSEDGAGVITIGGDRFRPHGCSVEMVRAFLIGQAHYLMNIPMCARYFGTNEVLQDAYEKGWNTENVDHMESMTGISVFRGD